MSQPGGAAQHAAGQHGIENGGPGTADIRRFDAVLSGYAYPFPVSSFPVMHRGQPLSMRYMDVSPQQPNGKVVLLLHGKNFVAASWGQTMRALLDRGYRVIAPDQIGFGKSEKPADYPFSFQGLAENTRALLASLGVQQSAVVGHSMGGMLATRYALMFPEHTSKLVLVNPIGLEDWKTVVPHRSVELLYADELAQTRDTLRAYQEKSYYAGVWKPEYDPYLEPLAGFTQDPDYPKVAWCSALTQEMIFTQPVVYELTALRVPTLLIIGQRDRTAIGKARAPAKVAETLGNYPRLGRATARAIPGSKLVELDGIGHLPQVEAFPRFIAELESFLKK
ncbi:MAG TPA: alpha/beta hydrolase [Polyangiaceae bacterium]|nr:alpha/beta hydrolase [Polyangiaceae bacterium]